MRITHWTGGIVALTALGLYIHGGKEGATVQESHSELGTKAELNLGKEDTRAVQSVVVAEVEQPKVKHVHGAGCGCAGHEVYANGDAQKSVGLVLTEGIQQHLFSTKNNAPITFALPGGGNAAGLVEHLRQENGETVMVQGTLDTPQKGRFFFQKQSADGLAGSLVGVVIFEKGDTAYSVVLGADGDPVLQEKHADKVICRNYARGSERPKEGDIQAIPANHPNPPTIPTYQGGVVPLSSLPGATAVVYLDFDGEQGPFDSWSNSDFTAAPAGNSNEDVREIWERVAEDFAPFNINVTTDLQVYLDAAETSRQRCIITPTDTVSPGLGGVAQVGTFNWAGDVPCWAFLTTGKDCAEVVSHEVGHTLGLYHDGGSTGTYYAGHGSGDTGWAPIMGHGYSKNLSQWSKGEYTSATNAQDDLNVITTANNGVAYRTDDHGNTLATASFLEIYADDSVASEGVIETAADEDGFKFTVTASSAVSLTVSPVADGPNLDILAEIVDSSGTVVTSDNPVGSLDATVASTLAAGEYFLRVSGVGEGDPLVTGYSDYASLGFYSVTGTVPNAITPDRFSIAEDPAANASVGTPTANNNHGGDTLSYAIASGNSSGAFAINSTTGELTVADASQFNYETLSTYYDDPAQFVLFIDITNSITPALSETVRVVVTVTDVVETPVFTANPITGTGAVMFTPYSSTISGSATDADGDWLSYSKISGPAWLTVASGGSLSGTPTLNDGGLNVFTVQVDDGRGETATATLNINVATSGTVFFDDFESYDQEGASDFSINDVPTGNWTPSDTATTATYIFSTGNFGDTVVWTSNVDGTSITSRGIDVGSNARYTMSAMMATEHNYGPHTLNANYDILVGQTAATATSIIGGPQAVVTYGDNHLNWDAKDDHIFTHSFETGSLAAGDKVFLRYQRVGILNVGDWFCVDDVKLELDGVNTPPSVSDSTFAIAESAIVGSVVGIVSATDPDIATESDALSYAITGGNTGGTFSINVSTGTITTATALDFETLNNYALTVEVDDLFGGSDTATITINVSDAHDAPVAEADALSLSANGGAESTHVHMNDSVDSSAVMNLLGIVTTPVAYDAGTSGSPQNPTTQGWSEHESEDGNVATGNVTGLASVNDNGSGFDAWVVTDNTGGGGDWLQYRQAPTAAETTKGNTNGWMLETKMRFIDDFGQGVSTQIEYGNGSTRFLVFFELNGSGDLTARTWGTGGATYTLTSNGSGDDLFRDIVILYDPVTQRASLTVDGVRYDTGTWAGNSNGANGVEWGNESSGGRGSAAFHSVKWSYFDSSVTASGGGIATVSGDAISFNPNGSYAALTNGQTAEETIRYALGDGAGFVTTGELTVTLIGENDSDADNLNDDWEQLHYGNLTIVSETSDTDGDGFTAFEEMVFGMDPAVHDAADTPIQSRIVDDAGMEKLEVKFRRPQNFAPLSVGYALQESMSLEQASWTDVVTVTPTITTDGDNEWLSFLMPIPGGAVTKKFYRCEVVPHP